MFTPRYIFQTTTEGPTCDGDDPSINCASLDTLLGNVCDEGSEFVDLCCDYCAADPTTTTTVMTTTTTVTQGPTTTGGGGE